MAVSIASMRCRWSASSRSSSTCATTAPRSRRAAGRTCRPTPGRRASSTSCRNIVRLREGWSSGEAQRAWEAVSALSSKPVRDQFQAWYRRENPESPQRVYGEKAIVRVAVTDVQKDAVTPGAYRVYFTRTERTGTADGRTIPMMASLRLRDIGNPQQIPWWQRVQFNGPAVPGLGVSGGASGRDRRR